MKMAEMAKVGFYTDFSRNESLKPETCHAACGWRDIISHQRCISCLTNSEGLLFQTMCFTIQCVRLNCHSQISGIMFNTFQHLYKGEFDA